MTARRPFLGAATLALLATALALPVARAADKAYKVVFQVSDADPAKWNLALNNVRNVQHDLGLDNVEIEIVAYGPGIGMLKKDSVVGSRIAQTMAAGTAVIAWENTMQTQKLSRADMLEDIGFVPAGVVELMKQQKEGYAYVRP